MGRVLLVTMKSDFTDLSAGFLRVPSLDHTRCLARRLVLACHPATHRCGQEVIVITTMGHKIS